MHRKLQAFGADLGIFPDPGLGRHWHSECLYVELAVEARGQFSGCVWPVAPNYHTLSNTFSCTLTVHPYS